MADEIPCWRGVLETLEPLWKLFPVVSRPELLIETEEWSALREAVQSCVDSLGLWQEEIEYPVTIIVEDRSLRVDLA
jgi:hypothetical protein